MTVFPSEVRFIHSLIQQVISENLPGAKQKSWRFFFFFLIVCDNSICSFNVMSPKLCVHKNHLGSLLKMLTSWAYHRNADS